jgi:hypothetical protein
VRNAKYGSMWIASLIPVTEKNSINVKTFPKEHFQITNSSVQDVERKLKKRVKWMQSRQKNNYEKKGREKSIKLNMKGEKFVRRLGRRKKGENGKRKHD